MSPKELVGQLAADVAVAIVRRMLHESEHDGALEIVEARVAETRTLRGNAQRALDEENARR